MKNVLGLAVILLGKGRFSIQKWPYRHKHRLPEVLDRSTRILSWQRIFFQNRSKYYVATTKSFDVVRLNHKIVRYLGPEP